MYSNIITKLHVTGIFCDLAKVFDCMNHEVLLAKLHFYGIWGVSKDLSQSCLTNKTESWSSITLFDSKPFLWLGNSETWCSSRINSRACVVHYICKWPSPENKFYTRTIIIYLLVTLVSWFQAEVLKICIQLKIYLSHMIKWFAANKLVLNIDKTYIMKFITIHHILHYVLVIKKSI